MSKIKETAIVSGASGFIGKHLIEALQERNIEAIPLSRAVLYDASELEKLVINTKPSYWFALHAYGNHMDQINPVEAVTANILNLHIMLHIASRFSFKAFINFSTSSIYGHQVKPMTEDTSPKPDTLYAATKAGGMYLARAYAKQLNLPIVSVVPFSVFGEGEADWRFIPTMCKAIVTREPMKFVAEPQHDWIYVKNFIDGVLTVTDHAKELQGEWVNIGMGEALTNAQVSKWLSYTADKAILMVGGYKEPIHHSPVWVAANSKLKSLGWKPRFTFEQGLRRTWDYYKDKYESERTTNKV